MRTLLFLLQKEFLQIKRNKTLLPMIFVLPIVQLIILVNAASLEIKHINMCVVDKDLSSTSRQMVSKFNGTTFFNITNETFSLEVAEDLLKQDKVDVIVHLSSGFERELVRNNKSKVQIIVNSINGTTAGVANAYISKIISEYNRQIITDMVGVAPKGQVLGTAISINTLFWYNPQLNYKNFMVPAVLVMLITIIGMFLSALNLVREKELGTIEQINVTPIKKYQFILGKLIPFWIIALFELGFGLIIGVLIFQIPTLGSIWLLYFVASIYLITILGLGLLVSTLVNTQQQAMFINFFFMLIFFMMSGVFTPVDSMPEWAKIVNYINPVSYFIRDVRMILLKGSGLKDVLTEIWQLSIFAVIILSLAINRYRKVA